MNAVAQPGLSESLKRIAQHEARQIMQDVDGVQAAVFSTVDGFDIASAIRPGFDASRIAALASSIAAIGDVVAKEAHLGSSKSVTVDTTSGVAMIFTVRRRDVGIVMIVVADKRALFGQIAYRMAASARLLADDSMP